MNNIALKEGILFFLLVFFSPANTNSGKVSLSVNKSIVKRDALKILSWNIYMLPHCSLIKGNARRAKAIAQELSGLRYDIIVFQEAFDYRARIIIGNVLKSEFPYMYGPANESCFSLRTNSGVWILSRIPLKKIKEIEFKSRFGIDAMARKGAVLFEGNWNNHEFQLIGTHLQADSPDEVRREQCKEIYCNLLRQYFKKDVPQLVCGDFNIEEADTANYNYMLRVLHAENGQMDGKIKVSYDEIDNQLAKRPNGTKQLIDYVLVRNDNFIRNIKRRVSVLRYNIKNKYMELSDHYGIEATINFTSEPGYTTYIGE